MKKIKPIRVLSRQQRPTLDQAVDNYQRFLGGVRSADRKLYHTILKQGRAEYDGRQGLVEKQWSDKQVCNSEFEMYLDVATCKVTMSLTVEQAKNLGPAFNTIWVDVQAKDYRTLGKALVVKVGQELLTLRRLTEQRTAKEREQFEQTQKALELNLTTMEKYV